MKTALVLAGVIVAGSVAATTTPSPAPPVDVLPPTAFTLTTPRDVQAPAPRIRKAPRVKPECSDPLAVALADAGWRGPENRVAWAIVMRESGGIASKVSGPNGQDRGLWQLNRPAWSGEPWWDEQALLDESYNIHAARLLWEEYGARPWGLTENGQLDPRDYERWSPEQQDRWIMAPWRKWYDAYPCKVAP